ncbi:FAD-binding oxidoreductase [Bacteroides sp. 214]|uniref:FAD-binding and (Fe-S)-binding domain-containing protein n=1 Tax=Bacteroides sp. 214 TaxID=2302935 RepID=UPI0013D09660|nr:FAD-binding and (Fe-S)-binding domain-containing protein [Bacteroides sp. 214]NDW12521.1 FAD-binding oxidoreductase [Bacteroides sp. 214]
MQIKQDTYRQFYQQVSEFIPTDRIYIDELRRLAWGTDAGFYRLIPQIIIRSANEEELSKILTVAANYRLPVTFRAAGTSLSGQAISNSILIVAGKHWESYTLKEEATIITMQPGIVGQRVNEILKPFGRKFAPDPASIKSAMVGGIVMNNASGMNCGTHANSDRVLLSVRMVFCDGTILDTGDAQSRADFQRTHAAFLQQIETLRDSVRADEELVKRIRYKYSIKNVVGLNISPFVLYDDPFDIIAHLLVGSEGTLAFLSEVTMRTERDYPHKASAMLYFSDIKEACRAVVMMKKLTNERGEQIVKGAELLDKKSLASVNDATGVGLTAVLTETFAETKAELDDNIAEITNALRDFATYIPVHFTDVESEYAKYWAIRSGIFPSVGGTRQLGTTSLIEDVAFHIEDLPEATAELQELLARHGYDDACIYGHALEGNYHFIINQSFSSDTEVARYEGLMNDVIALVVDKYDGSLKAEHGTGRNMAPFVKYEWGEAAFNIMKAVKQLFDPKNLLNPGVIFNDDPHCHIKNFKPLPLTNPHVDKCIECGFCEVNCLTCGFTLSSRQRIVLQREITRLENTNEDAKRLEQLRKQYTYQGEQTCAGDGLCATSCPMGIDTGDLTHDIRQSEMPVGSTGYKLGAYVAHHFAGTKNMLRPVLSLANTAHTLLGTPLMYSITKGMHNLLDIPQWVPAMPKAYRVKKAIAHNTPSPLKVVYFPSCINQTMGLAKKSPEELPLVNKMIALLHKAGYEVIFPHEMDKLCCGTIWESKGMMDIADQKTKELEAALIVASEQGKYPVLCDQSPCLYRMKHEMKSLQLYEPVEFINTFLLDKLVFTQISEPITVHITCSMQKMGLSDQLVSLAKRCSTHVLIPEEVGCCGFAGDKGFTHPEVNAYALRKLKPQIDKSSIKIGYSNSRTCEIGLSTNAGIPYVSIVYLVDKCTKSLNK